MKKLLCLFLGIITLSMGAMTSLSAHEQKHQSIENIAQGYKEGKYQAFLKQVHEEYLEDSKKWKYNDLLEERKKISKAFQDSILNKPDAYQKKLTALKEQENRELIDLCVINPSTPLLKEIKDMVCFTPSAHEQESLHFLEELGHKFKGDGKTPLENKLIEIDTEFWLKSRALELLAGQEKVDRETFQAKHAVLELEKLHQMDLAIKQLDSESSYQDLVATAQKVYPKVQAAQNTRKFLTDLGADKILPQTAMEEKLQAIEKKYQKKQATLVETYFSQMHTN